MGTKHLGVLVCCVLVLGCGERPLEPREPTPGVPHYRFATFNMAAFEEGDAETLEAIGGTDADVLGLQEITPKWAAAIAARYASEYPYQAFHADPDTKGQALLSRHPLTEHMFLPPNKDHPAWHAVVQTPAGPVQLLNVHLRATFDGFGDPFTSYVNKGGDHVAEIQSFVSTCKEALPSIVLGDFNEGVDGNAVEYLEARGYRNALPLFHPGQPTWHHRSVANQAELTLDHVLFNGSFEPLNAWVVPEGNSDHWPVVAHLEVAWDFARPQARTSRAPQN